MIYRIPKMQIFLGLVISANVAACSASQFTLEEKNVSECFAISVVYNGISKKSGAPAGQVASLNEMSKRYQRKFEESVSNLSRKDGDINKYSAITKEKMRLVADNPLNYKQEFARCI